MSDWYIRLSRSSSRPKSRMCSHSWPWPWLTVWAEDAKALNALTSPASEKSPLPSDVAAWLDKEASANVDDIPGEWSDDEVYLSLPRPGGDAWLSIDRKSGAIEYEVTERGWVSYLNDLHKGRNTGSAWSWFIDIFALACVVFAGTGAR